MLDYTHTSVSVTEGHPDKLCDQISDAVVERLQQLAPGAEVEVECAVATGVVFVACHAASDLRVDVAEIARGVIAGRGYSARDFDPGSVPVMVSIGTLPAAPRDTGARRLAADHNVTTFGYATDQTANLMPLPIELAHRLARRLSALGRPGATPRIGPDAQAQVAVRFEARRPVAVEAVTLLADPWDGSDGRGDDFSDALRAAVVDAVLAEAGQQPPARDRVFVNRSAWRGRGPAGHPGVTGRKLGVDMYGDYSRQSSSALSGKSLDRIDRIATYAARNAAKNLVAAGLARECEVQLCYTVGHSQPASVEVDTFGSGSIPDAMLRARLREWLDLQPAAVIAAFGGSAASALPLQRLAVFGQVGRGDLDLPWERTGRAVALRG
jgi:S-adenosylmethionine synthetase